MTHLSNEFVSTSDTSEPLSSDSHLVPLTGTAWRLWRSASLRGTGFPVQLVEQLAATNLAAAADHLLDTEDHVQKAREAALDALRHEIEINATNDDQRSLLIKILRQIKKGKLPPTTPTHLSRDTALNHFCHVSTLRDQAWIEFQSMFECERDRISDAVVSIAQDARFCEAIIWQNRKAFHTGVAAFLRHASRTRKRNARYRQNELLIANYLQRYCVKNDRIGFFGPTGWAEFHPEDEPLFVRPQRNLLISRTVYLESWGIHKIAQQLARNPALLPWMIPRRLPHLALQNRILYAPSQEPRELAPILAQVLDACDGHRCAQDVAKHLLEMPVTPFKNIQHVYLLLAQLQQKMGLLEWNIPVPTHPHAEDALRHMLNNIEDGPLRTTTLAILDELESRRKAIAQAAGNPAQLDQAIEQLELSFSQLTNQNATRGEGHMFVARTLIYEDCQRGIDLRIGADIVQALAPPLQLLLTSARWFSFEAMQVLKQHLASLYNKLVTDSGKSTIDGPSFWGQAQQLFDISALDTAHPMTPVLECFQSHWADILAISAADRAITYTSDQLRSRVEELFHAPYPGWRLARYHSPDIMIAASSADAIQKGEYQLVLGELHMGTISINAASFVEQYPHAQELQNMVAVDIPEPRIIPIAPHNWPGVTTRSSTAFRAPKDFHLVWSQDVWTDPSTQVLPIGDLVIMKGAYGLEAQTRNGRLRFDIMDLMDLMLATSLNSWFTLFNVAHYRYIPRITIDKLIVHRETWICDPEHMDFVYAKDETQRFIQARRWMRQMKLPRYVFVKSPVEPKPFYVDFASPVYIELLVKTVRRAQQASTANRMVISEMVPDPSQSWLTDANNQRYTCELRCVAVDSRQYPSLPDGQPAI